MTILDHEFSDLPTQAGPMRTHIFRPAAEGRYPGIMLFSEIFQVTGPIRRTAALLAGNGFIVAVPEIFHMHEAPGTVLGYDSAGADRGNWCKVNTDLAQFDADMATVREFL
jgi:carboxymethylenebutenolidase